MTLVLGVVQVGSGDTSGVPFIVIVVAIALIVAGVVWRFGAWALVLGAIAGLLGTVFMFGSYLITAASNVNSVFDFVAVIGTVGSILVLVGSIVHSFSAAGAQLVPSRHPQSAKPCKVPLLS